MAGAELRYDVASLHFGPGLFTIAAFPRVEIVAFYRCRGISCSVGAAEAADVKSSSLFEHGGLG